MIDKQAGPRTISPNTLRDQTAPNTFRNQIVPTTPDGQRRNTGGGRIAPAGRLQLPLLVYVAIVALAVVGALYVLTGTP